MPLTMAFNLEKMAFQERFHIHGFVLHTKPRFQGRADKQLLLGIALYNMRAHTAYPGKEFNPLTALPLTGNLTCLWNGFLALIEINTGKKINQ